MAMPRFSRGATLVLACLAYLAAGVTLASVGPSLAALAANIGRDVAVVGSQFTAFAAGTVLVQFAAPPLGARYGRRTVLLLGLLLMGGGVLGESLSGSLALLLGFALLGGLGFGSILAAGSVMVPLLFPARGASALNLVNLFFGVGSIIGPLVAGWAATLYERPQAGMWLGSGLLLLLVPAALFAAEGQAPTLKEGADAGQVPWVLVLLLGLLLLVYSGTEIGLGGWAAIYLQESGGMGAGEAAVAVAGFWMALTVGRGLGALLGLRLGPWLLLTVALGGILAGAGLMVIWAGDAARSAMALLLLGLACGPVFPTAMALVAAESRGRGGAASLALGVGNLGGACIPPLMGVIVAGPEPRGLAGLVLAMGALLIGLLVAATWASRLRPVRAPAH